MLELRDQFRGREALALAGGPSAASFGRRDSGVRDAPARFDLVVDLGEDLFSRRWWRGAATLALLCGAVGLLAPAPFEPLPGGSPERISGVEAAQYHDLAIAPASRGGTMGGRMAATSLVEPLSQAPDRPHVEYFAKLTPGDTLVQLLQRAGANVSDAARAAALIASASPRPIVPGTSIAIRLGRKEQSGVRSIERVALRAGLDLNLAVIGSPQGLSLSTSRVAVDTTPLRIRGRVGDGLYWSLRSSGVASASASEYLKALSGQLDVGGDIGPDDHFDLVIANRRAATGENEPGPLLYAAIDRAGASDVKLMKWTIGGRTDWIDANGAGRQVSTMAWPVAARITSNFGLRYHPILHFARMHKGIDFGARWGQPIVAAADGQVMRAGWAGGYGQQVRLAHGGGMATSYSHMSRMVVSPGSYVRQGQLIGYVGTTGLSTGPHLHYEVYRGGVAVNPLSVRFSSRSLLEGDDLNRFKARLAQLMALGGQGRS